MEQNIPDGHVLSSQDVRTLKIEAVGDFWKGDAKPKIRLAGRWLERAGFRPGERVRVTCVRPGVLELHFVGCAAIGDGARSEHSPGP